MESASGSPAAASVTRVQPVVVARLARWLPSSIVTFAGLADRTYALKQYRYPAGAEIVCTMLCAPPAGLLACHAFAPPAGSAMPVVTERTGPGTHTAFSG